MTKGKSDHLHGTLELVILRLLATETMNGYGLGRRIEELTADVLKVDEGSLYPALYRMEQRGWLKSAWARTENNRRAKFYRITTSGRRRLSRELSEWSVFTEAVEKILESA